MNQHGLGEGIEGVGGGGPSLFMMIKMERILTFYNNDLANFDCFYIIKGSLTFYDSQNERGGVLQFL